MLYCLVIYILNDRVDFLGGHVLQMNFGASLLSCSLWICAPQCTWGRRALLCCSDSISLLCLVENDRSFPSVMPES